MACEICTKTQPLLAAELQETILQNQSLCEKDILKKDFQTFVSEKFRKPRSACAKPSNPVHESKKKQAAEIEYRELFRKRVEQEFSTLYAIYKNAYAGGNLASTEKGIVIIGSNELRNPQILSNFGKLDETTAGCIFAPSRWNMLKNVLMMLGAIHAHKTFMLQYPAAIKQPEDEMTLFWDEDHNVPKTLAGEVVMLLSAGYQLYPYQAEEKLGKIFVCTHPDIASAFTLEKAYKVISSLSRTAKVLPDILKGSYKS